MNSPPVTYLPAYLGLWLSLVLAVACNAFLDIHYGSFGKEMLVWSAVFAFSLAVAWRQQGVVDAGGLRWQKVLTILAGCATLLLFIPIWGFPRAGLYLLAGLQAATACVTVDRRKFMFALLASAVMVMFASVHLRADWTMMFYLVPYLVAVTLTLVAEQVGRRMTETAVAGFQRPSVAGQFFSIGATTLTILATATALFMLTPQVTRFDLSWKYGLAGLWGGPQGKEKAGFGGHQESGGGSGQTGSGPSEGAGGHSGAGDQDILNGEAGASVGDGYREAPPSARPSLPTAAEMRQAAARPGMPVWQASALYRGAAAMESIQHTLQPVAEAFQSVLEQARRSLAEHRQDLLRTLFAALVALLFGAAWMLLRELRPVLWLQAHFDYLRFGLLGLHAEGNRAALQYFAAMQALYGLHHVQHDGRHTAREYQARVSRIHGDLERETAMLVGLFERARYGNGVIAPDEIGRARQAYRRIFASL